MKMYAQFTSSADPILPLSGRLLQNKTLTAHGTDFDGTHIKFQEAASVSRSRLGQIACTFRCPRIAANKLHSRHSRVFVCIRGSRLLVLRPGVRHVVNRCLSRAVRWQRRQRCHLRQTHRHTRQLVESTELMAMSQSPFDAYYSGPRRPDGLPHPSQTVGSTSSSASTSWRAFSRQKTMGGLIFRTFPWRPVIPISRPGFRRPFTIAAASPFAGSRVVRSRTSSNPMNRPCPGRSPMSSCLSCSFPVSVLGCPQHPARSAEVLRAP